MDRFDDWLAILAIVGLWRAQEFLAAEDQRTYLVLAAERRYASVVGFQGLVHWQDPNQRTQRDFAEAVGRMYDVLKRRHNLVLDRMKAEPGALQQFQASVRTFEAELDGVDP